MVQLQLLDLMISRECGAAPYDQSSLSSRDHQLGRSDLARVHADCSRPFRKQEGSGAAIGLLSSSGGDHVSGRPSGAACDRVAIKDVISFFHFG